MGATELGLIGAILGVLPAIFGGISSWLRSRDQMSQSRRREELRKLEIENVSSWIDAALKIPDKTIVERHMLSATERLEFLTSRSIEDEIPNRKSGIWRAALYAVTGFILFLIFGMSIDDQDEVSIDQLIQEFGNSDLQVALFLLGLFWIAVFYKARKR